jgi:hypothetical protein
VARKLFFIDPAYERWRREFSPFEASCFKGVCEYVDVNFDGLLDGYYYEGHEALNDFPGWVFERYLRWTAGAQRRRHPRSCLRRRGPEGNSLC